MPEWDVDKKKLQELFCWARFYQNSKELAVPVHPNEKKYQDIQIEIEKLKKDIYSIK